MRQARIFSRAGINSHAHGIEECSGGSVKGVKRGVISEVSRRVAELLAILVEGVPTARPHAGFSGGNGSGRGVGGSSFAKIALGNHRLSA
jgi:hypothetical protein